MNLRDAKLTDYMLDPPDEKETIDDVWHQMKYVADNIMTYTAMSIKDSRVKCVRSEVDELIRLLEIVERNT